MNAETNRSSSGMIDALRFGVVFVTMNSVDADRFSDGTQIGSVTAILNFGGAQTRAHVTDPAVSRCA
ncbi:hypothetical protein G6K86_31415 [Agrobacterium rhizogenes]|nr:hypothetical protein [Rhizobium rhizogenes]